MALGKRKRVSSARAVRTSMRVGNWASLVRASRARKKARTRGVQRLSTQVRRISRMIETKHGQWTSGNNLALPHNNTFLITKDDGGVLNPFQSTQGASDPMTKDNFQRIGDRISVKGMLVKGFFEGALSRTKVYFRVMLLRGSKGETFSRANIFKGLSDNKMIDQLNTERISVVWQRIFTVTPPNSAAASVNAAGEVASTTPAGITGNRIIKAWIPGICRHAKHYRHVQNAYS
jgi:hypothetical protein